MSEPLRPLTTGELLDRTFHLYRNNFMLFTGIATVIAISVVIAFLLMGALGISFVARGEAFTPGSIVLSMLIFLGVFAIFYMIGFALATGATIYAVSKVNLGRPVTIRESYKNVFPRLGRIILVTLQIVVRLFGLLLLLYLCLVLLILLLTMIFSGTGESWPRIFVSIVMVAGVIAMYVIFIRYFLKYSLAIPVCMLENTRTTESIKRSSFLTRDYLGRVFLVYLLMWILTLALSWVLHSPEFLLKNVPLGAIVFQSLATFVAFTISFPIGTIATSLLYYDLRIRKEAFDLQLMIESLGQAQEQAAAAPASTVG